MNFSWKLVILLYIVMFARHVYVCLEDFYCSEEPKVVEMREITRGAWWAHLFLWTMALLAGAVWPVWFVISSFFSSEDEK